MPRPDEGLETRMRQLRINASRIVGCDAPFPIWMVRASAERCEDALTMLAPMERDRAARFRCARLRARYIATHAALRLLVERYFGLSCHRQVYAMTDFGKPHLVDFPQVQCSLSYSGDRALVAMSPAHEIGVDLEHLREITDAAELARRYFTVHEQSKLATQGHDPSAFQREFLAIWTRKEACLKAVGRGLAFPLAKVECVATETMRTVVIEDDRLRIGAIEIDDAYTGSWAQRTSRPCRARSGDARHASSQ